MSHPPELEPSTSYHHHLLCSALLCSLGSATLQPKQPSCPLQAPPPNSQHYVLHSLNFYQQPTSNIIFSTTTFNSTLLPQRSYSTLFVHEMGDHVKEKLSRFANSGEGSSSRCVNTAITHCRNHSGKGKEIVVFKEKEKRSLMGCKQHLSDPRAPGSNQLADNSRVRCSKNRSCKSDVLEEIEGRLKLLEEEIQMEKREFLEGIKDRKKLIQEVCLLLRTTRHRVNFTRKRGEDSIVRTINQCPKIASLHTLDEGRAKLGLLQVLDHDSNPSPVTKDFRDKIYFH